MTSIALPSAVRLIEQPSGMSRLEISTPLASASVTLYGAQVAHFTPVGEDPVLFFSSESYCTPGKPMRGGAPVIFPWFGAHPTDSEKPAHGFARTRDWTLESATQKENGEVTLVLRLEPDAEALRLWPEGGSDWVLCHRIVIGKELTMELEVQNRGGSILAFEDALHTYFAISDIREIEVRGLESTEYLTVIEDAPRKRQPAEPIHFERETDRVYLSTAGQVEIVDAARTIAIRKEGAASVIVWNPWTEKAARLADLGDDEWPGMVCVETGNVRDNGIRLPSGGTHRSTTRISVQH